MRQKKIEQRENTRWKHEGRNFKYGKEKSWQCQFAVGIREMLDLRLERLA